MNANRHLGAWLAGAAAIVAANLLGTSPAQAYCVYNKTNATIKVTQEGGGIDDMFKRFRAELAPGKDSCCNWQTKDCNSGGKRTSKVTFAAWIEVYPNAGTEGHKFPYLLCAVETTANGWLDVVGSIAANPVPHLPVADKTWGNSVACKAYAGPPGIAIWNGISGKCLDVSGFQNRDGAEVITWDCNNGANQIWELTKAGEIRGYGDRCLDVSAASNSNGAKVQMWACNGGNNQKWRLDGAKIVGVASNKCLDVVGAQKTRGASLNIWDCSGGENQKWSKTNAP